MAILIPLVVHVNRPNYYALAPRALNNGDLDAAEKYYRLGLQQAIREDAHYFIAVTHQGLADVAMAREDWPTAEKEARTTFDELICPVNMQCDKFSRDTDMVKCFSTMGYVKIAQGDYEKGIREIEEADRIETELYQGMSEPNTSIRMSRLYRGIARATGQPRYYQRALERIKKAEDGVVSFKFGNLSQTIAHANVLRERAAIVREYAIRDEDPDGIEEQADRMEKAFRDREKADRERHGYGP
jgi:tetratricopeptide (TPR) repeat protein